MANPMFDTSQNRLNYGELLQSDLGCSLDFAVGLTYSLDLEALLGVPISLGILDEMDTSLRDNPFYLLEAIRKSSDKLAIFCNAGGISLPQKIQSVYSLLENSVFEVKLQNKQNFHPKLWFIKYTNNESRTSYIKLIVLSRNLTFDNSLDLAFEFVGEIGKAKRNKNLPLFDMLRFVAEFSNKTKKEKIMSLAAEVLNVKEFIVSSPFADYTFLPLGIEGYAKDATELFRDNRDVFVVSPFLSDDIVTELTKINGRKTLVTRKASVNQNAMKSFDNVYITKDILTDNEFGTKQDIHAKLYFTAGNAGNHLYLGSANASHNAFYKNVEFLLKLKYDPYMISYERIFNDLIPQENCPFEKITSMPIIEESKEEQEIDSALKEAVWAIKGAKVLENGEGYDVEVRASSLKTGKEIRIAPLQKSYALVPLEKITLLKNILLKELSEFYVIAVEDKKIVVKIETKNMPQGRDDAVYKGIISSKNAFLSYVSFMLSENYSESAYEQSEYLKLLDSNASSTAGTDNTAAVYEKMLKAVVKNPKRLNEISDVINRLDDDVIGKEFMEMYEQFKLAVGRLGK